MTNYLAVLEQIRSDARYAGNLDWGQPRKGHPEATIRAHIAELEKNLRRLAERFAERGPIPGFWFMDHLFCRLRVLIHVHDTMKPESNARYPGKHSPPTWHPDSHSSLARAFLAEFIPDDVVMLQTVQCHDEPFALWRQVEHKGKYNRDRFQTLVETITDWDLFMAFQIIDGCTVGKSAAPRIWLFNELAARGITTRLTGDDAEAVDAANRRELPAA